MILEFLIIWKKNTKDYLKSRTQFPLTDDIDVVMFFKLKKALYFLKNELYYWKY